MEDFYEKTCLCALNTIFGFKPRVAQALLTHIGSARDIFRMNSKEKEMLLGPCPKEAGLISVRSQEEAMRQLERLAKSGISFIGWSEPDYPELLKECNDAPIGLYIRSRTPASALFDTTVPYISVIGTRDITPYGREWCSRIVEGMASTTVKPVIVSGLALGTDICAHRTALENGLPTIAVMATGPDDIYPMRHRYYAEAIAQAPGSALITDYPPGTKALPVHFIRRNRIIAGLSKASILIESKAKGGGMMTSRLAFSYNRDVYALPGRADDLCSQGCNALIKAKVAEPVISVENLMESLGLGTPAGYPETSVKDELEKLYGVNGFKDRIEMMSAILLTIRRHRGISVEDIAAACGISYSKAAELTGMLETDGFISIDLLQRCCIRNKRT